MAPNLMVSLFLEVSVPSILNIDESQKHSRVFGEVEAVPNGFGWEQKTDRKL